MEEKLHKEGRIRRYGTVVLTTHVCLSNLSSLFSIPFYSLIQFREHAGPCCCVLSDSSSSLEHLLLGDEVGGTAKNGVAHSRLHKHTRDVLARIPALLGSLQFFKKKKKYPKMF